MKQITVSVPENQYDFFVALMRKLGFNEKGKTEFVLTSAHKKIIDKRLKDMDENPNDETDWSSLKKKLKKKL